MTAPTSSPDLAHEPPPHLALEGVTKRFGAVTAVDGVSLSVARGAFVALIGASGSGKSTLLKMINRLIEPDAGRVWIDGADAAGEPAPALRRRLGYVFQGAGLFPHLSVADNVAVTPRLLGWEPARIADRVATLLTRVKLDPDVAKRPPAALSGGQQQRVAFARALAAEPAALLLDEPFGALDPATREALQTDLKALHTGLGLTTIMVTHDMAEALLLADRVVVLREGRIVQDAPPARLIAKPADADVAALVATPRRQARALEALMDVSEIDGAEAAGTEP